MQGVEAMIDPHRLGSGERSGDRLAGLLHLPGAPRGRSPKECWRECCDTIQNGFFGQGSSPLGNWGVRPWRSGGGLRGENGDATGAGVALAAWDDSQFLAGPSPDIVAEIMALLTQTNTLSHGGRRQGQEPPAHLPGDSTPVSGFSATRPTSSDGANVCVCQGVQPGSIGVVVSEITGRTFGRATQRLLPWGPELF